MEDIPQEIKHSLEEYSKELGFEQTFIIDSHNSLGEKIEKQHINIFVDLGKQCLQTIKNSEQHEFKIGYSNSFHVDQNKSDTKKSPDLGNGQFGILILSIKNREYGLCWCDSNNMKNGIREMIMESLCEQDFEIIEVCTSDTHSTSGKRNTKGYYTLGDITNSIKIVDVFKQLIKQAQKSINDSEYEIYKSECKVLVMGNDQFDDYSNALEKSFKVTKIFLAVTFVIYVAMLLVT
jgi:putative membrane protein